ncbi:MAG: hypothetical protein HYU99_06345 [Deltaproteobacteria bacterium]|nr:hypothetical protein [Deltaproteobacteria bacterium]
MKIAALIIGLIGSLAALGLGSKWVTDYNKYESTIASMQQMADQMGAGGAMAESLASVGKLKNAGYALVGLGLLALLASILVFKLGKLSGLVMLIAAIVPGVLAPQAFVATAVLIVGGILALLTKPKQAVA